MTPSGEQSATAPSGSVARAEVHTWQFGAFEFDAEAGVLRKFGLKVRISPQVVCVLRILLQRAGELIEREELAEALWPEGVHVDFEGNLNTIIRDARKALDDSARKPRFIETQFKRGYRFVAPVRALTPQGGAQTAPVAEPELHDFVRSSPWMLRIVAAIAVVALMVTGWVYYRWRANADALPATPQVTQLTNYLGAAAHPSFSPDGTRVAFEWNGDEAGRYAIWIKEIVSGNLKRLTNSQGDEHSPAWSPDGRDIAFARDISQRDAALLVMPALGGNARQLAVLPRGCSFVWSPDGRWIVYSVSWPDYVRNSGSDPGIQAISLETGQTTRVTAPNSTLLGDAFPAFSPDGKWLAFFRLTSLAEGELYAVRIDRNLKQLETPRKLTTTQRDGRDPVWLPGSREVVFSAGSEGYHGLWLAGFEHAPRPLWSGEDAIQSTLDVVHARLAYTRLSLVDSLNTIDLCGPGCTPAPAKRVLFAERRAFNPHLSPDGDLIAFESFRSGHMDIWMCTRDGSNPRQLTHFDGPLSGTPHWSPDGQSIALDSRVNGKGKIFVLTPRDGRVRQFTSGSFDDVVPSWSHDGKWIYFASNRSGSFQVWKAAVAGGEPVQITKNGGFYAQESADRRTLYYARDAIQTPVWKVPVDGGREEEVIPSVSAWQNFAPARDGIYFVSGSHAAPAIHFYDFASHATRTVAPIDGLAVQGFTVSNDERHIVFSKRESASSDLMLLEGGLLRGRIGTP